MFCEIGRWLCSYFFVVSSSFFLVCYLRSLLLLLVRSALSVLLNEWQKVERERLDSSYEQEDLRAKASQLSQELFQSQLVYYIYLSISLVLILYGNDFCGLPLTSVFSLLAYSIDSVLFLFFSFLAIVFCPAPLPPYLACVCVCCVVCLLPRFVGCA